MRGDIILVGLGPYARAKYISLIEDPIASGRASACHVVELESMRDDVNALFRTRMQAGEPFMGTGSEAARDLVFRPWGGRPYSSRVPAQKSSSRPNPRPIWATFARLLSGMTGFRQIACYCKRPQRE